VPVLLSRVNRIGVREATPTRKTGSEDVLRASARNRVYAASSTSGNTQYTESESLRAGPDSLTIEVLRLTPNKSDAAVTDIALDGVWTGVFLENAVVGFLTEEWAEPKGRKVWTK
jgi:hypothetical protein